MFKQARMSKATRAPRFTTLLLFLPAALTAMTASSRADQYWISYDGTLYPEEAGWTRATHGGGAVRCLQEGALVLDGREDNSIGDAYSMHRLLDPEPGELFVMRLRVKVDELTSGPWDPAFGVTSDESWSAAFQLSDTQIFNMDDLGMNASFEPGVFHTFELRSWDMRGFELCIDGSVALTGSFTRIISASRITWGDETVGGASLSSWDYFEFGVVPEPSGAAGLLVLGLIGLGTKRTQLLARS